MGVSNVSDTVSLVIATAVRYNNELWSVTCPPNPFFSPHPPPLSAPPQYGEMTLPHRCGCHWCRDKLVPNDIACRWLTNNCAYTEIWRTKSSPVRFRIGSRLQQWCQVNDIDRKKFHTFPDILRIIKSYVWYRGLHSPGNHSIFVVDDQLYFIFRQHLMHESTLIPAINRHLVFEDRSTCWATLRSFACGFRFYYDKKFFIQPGLYRLLKPYASIPLPPGYSQGDHKPQVFDLQPYGCGEGISFRDLISLLIRYCERRALFRDQDNPSIALLLNDPLNEYLGLGAFARYEAAIVIANLTLPPTLTRTAGLAIVKRLCENSPCYPQPHDLTQLGLPRTLLDYLISLGAQHQKNPEPARCFDLNRSYIMRPSSFDPQDPTHV